MGKCLVRLNNKRAVLYKDGSEYLEGMEGSYTRYPLMKRRARHREPGPFIPPQSLSLSPVYTPSILKQTKKRPETGPFHTEPLSSFNGSLQPI